MNRMIATELVIGESFVFAFVTFCNPFVSNILLQILNYSFFGILIKGSFREFLMWLFIRFLALVLILLLLFL